MRIDAVPAAEFPDLYPRLKWHFDDFEARGGGECPAVDLVSDVLSGARQCWVAQDGDIWACALTKALIGRIGVVELTHCNGRERERWQEQLMAEIERWARHIGANRLRVICRPGHTRFLKEIKFRETHRVLERDL